MPHEFRCPWGPELFNSVKLNFLGGYELASASAGNCRDSLTLTTEPSLQPLNCLGLPTYLTICITFYVGVCVGMGMPRYVCMEVRIIYREQVHSFHCVCEIWEFWNSNSCCQTWWQVPLTPEPSHWAFSFLFILSMQYRLVFNILLAKDDLELLLLLPPPPECWYRYTLPHTLFMPYQRQD